MKLRIANKLLRHALNTGECPRGSTMERAVSAFPRGVRNHPKRYMSGGLVAAFLRMGVSISEQQFMCDGMAAQRAIESLGK